MNREIHTNCPDESVLEKIAAGVCPAELETSTLQHAALCKVCGPRLRRYVKIFSQAPLSDSETALLSQLQTSQPEWQREWVRKNVVSPQQNDSFARVQVPSVPWWRKVADVFKPLSLAPGRMVMAGAALAVVVLAVLGGPKIGERIQIQSAQNKVASAFVERRTTEMRLTSVGYAPHNAFAIELGGESGRDADSMSVALLEARSEVAKKLRSGKADPQWLQIEGRIFLWESTSSSLEKAEKDFAKAKAEGLDSASLEIDLAASYFERDSRAEHPNLQRSLNLLTEVLSKGKLSKQERATALYDLAIVYEKTQARDLAVSTWEEYLKVDSTGDWADQARQHLKDAKSKPQGKREESYESPSYFLDQFSQHSLKPEDPEQYQQKALGLWVPKAMENPESADDRAIDKLADVLQEEHDDFWWRDFRKALQPGDLAAVQDLNAAVAANEKGVYEQAIEHSQDAARVFAQNKNIPGNLRARFEEVYAQRSMLKDCLARAGPLGDELSATKYRWLQGQLSLEKAQCMKFHGEFAEADIEAQSSRSIAQRFGFPVLELRILGISASMNHQQGRCNEAWSQATEGLERYWKGAYPRDRLDQFYAVMWQCTEESGSLYAAEVLLQHTLDMRRDAKVHNRFREAMVHFRLRNMYMSQRQDLLENRENATAASLLDENIPDIRLYRLITEIEPAELQLQQGDAERALATLEPVRTALTGVQDNFINLSFYRVLGNIYWELRRLDEAEKAYQTAIKIADNAMAGIADGNERISWLRATDESYRGLVRVLLEQKRGQEALERWERYQSRPMFQGLRSDGREPADKFPTKIEKKNSAALRPASTDTHLVYASFKDGLQIWVSNSKGVQGRWVSVKQQDFERAVRDFSEHCATPQSSLSEVHQQGKWLFTQLLQPVISELPQSKVVVVELDRSANNLSMESLMSPDGWYFGERYPVLYSPGARMEQSLRLPERLGAQAPVLLLDASHAPESGYLPGMEDQRNAISQLFPRAKIIDSASVSWAEARSHLAASTVLHYMGHGRPDGTGTSLAYNASQSLRARDFTPELLKRSQLVVLAACSSGLGKNNGLWDTNSLVHAFLTAGVPHVVSSHWNVDSATTSQLMVSFYRNVAANHPVPQAVYEARMEILANKPHPYYWASFSLTGRVN